MHKTQGTPQAYFDARKTCEAEQKFAAHLFLDFVAKCCAFCLHLLPMQEYNSTFACRSGIYAIQSKKYPDRFYIGSAIELGKRRRAHNARLKSGNHPNKILQAHYNKYGSQDLIYWVMELCLQSELLLREQLYLDQKKPSFNICTTARNTFGRPQSEETKRKRVESIRNGGGFGHSWDREARQNQSIAQKKRAEREGKKVIWA